MSGLGEVPWSSKASRSIGLAPLSTISLETGSSLLGLSSRKDSGWAKALESFVVPGLDCRGPSLPLAEDRAQLGAAHPSMLTGPSLLGGPDFSISSFWVKDGLRRPFKELLDFEERSKIDCALMEEALRYGNDSIPIGTLVSGSSSSPSSFSDQTPLGEYYDLSGAGLEIT